MALANVFLSDLQSGRSNSADQVRLLRYWEARNSRRGGELMGIDMLIVDARSTQFPAAINVSRLGNHRHNLKAGSVYTLTGFDVTGCGQNYRLTDSPLMIRFNDMTTFAEVAVPDVTIPVEFFRFRTHGEMLALANTNSQLPDIKAELTAVRSTVSDPPQEKNRVMATIRIDNDVSVTMSLFDSQAVKFHKQLEKMNVDPRLIVATSINPKLVGGRLFLNATFATHIYFDKQTNAGESYFYRLAARDTGLPPAAPLLRGYAKVEQLSIAELNAYILSAASQEADFICTGKVKEIKMDKGWCYVSCSVCSRKLQRTTTGFACPPCDRPSAVGVLRYRVEMCIADETGEGQFVCFDGVMTKLHSMRAQEAVHLLGGEVVNAEETNAPPFVAEMVGKTYTFQVKLGAYNFTANHQSFTISRILGVGDPMPVPDFNGDGGDDGNGGGGQGDQTVAPKFEYGGSSHEQGGSAKVKKTRTA